MVPDSARGPVAQEEKAMAETAARMRWMTFMVVRESLGFGTKGEFFNELRSGNLGVRIALGFQWISYE